MEISSPYQNVYALQYDNNDVSLERIPYEHMASPQDIIHTILEGETITSIAYQYYKDSGKWYIIADTNNIYNPIADLKVGQEIIIPYGR